MIGSVACVFVAAGIAMRPSASAASRITNASPREDPDPGSAGGIARNRRITPQSAGGHRNSGSRCSSSENSYGNRHILTSRENLAGLNDATMMMALIRPLMMQDFNVPCMKTRSPKQYCKAPCRLLMGRLRHHGLEQPWARASRTRLRPRG